MPVLLELIVTLLVVISLCRMILGAPLAFILISVMPGSDLGRGHSHSNFIFFLTQGSFFGETKPKNLSHNKVTEI